MSRKSKYETHVLPYLGEIKKWIRESNEKQIAKRLGITQTSLENYKKKYPELVEAIHTGKQDLVEDLKDTLKKKARGFYYTETKTYIKDEDGKKVKIIEKYEKYAQPDTGAIHLLLKNNDPDWTNDDKATMELKRRQVEVAEKKASQNDWT